MKYLLLLTNNAEDVASWEGLSDEEAQKLREAEMPAWGELFGWIGERGYEVDGLELDSPTEAKLVQVRDGETLVTDGPFAETKEQLGGFCLLECENLDEALKWANKVPMQSGAIEVRAIMDLSQFGYESKTLTPAKAPA